MFQRKKFVELDENKPLWEQKITNWDGQEEKHKHLPTQQSREIVTRSVHSAKNPDKTGTQQVYTMTLMELTEHLLPLITQMKRLEFALSEIEKTQRQQREAYNNTLQLKEEMKDYKKTLANFAADYKFHTELPKIMEDFTAHIENNLRLREMAMDKTQTDIYNQLNNLLNGEARPPQESLDAMTTIVQQLEVMSRRLNNLERHLK